jgi:hypothetical protein
MKTVPIGIYPLGPMRIRLEFTADYGGSFSNFGDKPTQLPLIQVGFGDGSWDTVVATLLHEAFECAAMHTRCRFAPAPDFAYETSGYTFIMQHAEFSEVAARAGQFIARSLPDLATEYNRWAKRSKRRKG